MKKSVLIILLILLVFPLTSAISTTMKAVYQPGETMIIEIRGNILQPIEKSDVVFKRSNVAVAPIYDVKRVGDKYFLYAQLNAQQFNVNTAYTLFINNIDTTVNGVVTSVNFNQTFSLEGNISAYSINPGFAISSTDLEFIITSNLDQQQSINADFPSEQAITLNPGANQIVMPIESAAPGFRVINMGIYQVPVMILGQGQTQQNVRLRIFPPRLESTILSGEAVTYPIQIINDGDTNVTGAYFDYDFNLFEITPSIIGTIAPNETKYFNLTLRNADAPINNEITIRAGEFSKAMLLSINLTENASQIITPYLNSSNINSLLYCSEIKEGKFCAANEVCSGETSPSLDGQCCVGSCEVQEETSYSWVGWLFLVIAILIIAYIFLKYRKGKKKNALPEKKDISLGEALLKSP